MIFNSLRNYKIESLQIHTYFPKYTACIANGGGFSGPPLPIIVSNRYGGPPYFFFLMSPFIFPMAFLAASFTLLAGFFSSIAGALPPTAGTPDSEITPWSVG